MNSRLAAAALVLLAAAGPSLAPPAEAAPSKFALKVKAEKDTVKLGERIHLTVTLENRSARAATPAPLAIGSPSGLVFDIRTEKGDFQVSRLFGKYPGSEFKADAVTRQELKAGKTLDAPVALLALVPGKMEITAVYLGLEAKDSPAPVTAKTVTVKVEPGPGGETKVGARIRTGKGVMTAALYPEKAYNTVHNFLWLAQEHFYDRKVFHRIVKDFMVQTGCPKGNGTGGPGYYIPAEFNDLKHEKGVLSMAREPQHKNTAGSQFFVVHGTTPALDGSYTGFGRVVEGVEALDGLAGVPVRLIQMGNRAEMSDPIEKPTLDGVDLVLLK